MNIHSFYRQFEDLPNGRKFDLIRVNAEPVSLFVIFKRLGEVRAQKKYFEEQEAHLLQLAEVGFKQLNDKSKTT